MPYITSDKRPENFDERCDSCHKEIAPTHAYFNCDYCQKCFHPHCKLIFGSHIKRMALQKKWMCCTKCQEKSDRNNQSTSSNTQGKPKILTKTPNTQTKTSSSQLQELIKQVNDNMMKRFSDIQQSQEFLSAQFDEFNNEIKKLTMENKTLKAEIQQLKNNQTKYEDIINNLESKIDTVTQDKLSNNFIIAGIPNTNEKPSEIIRKICNHFELPEQTLNDIRDIYYITNKPNNQSSRLISVKCQSIKLKQLIFSKKLTHPLTVRMLGINNHDSINDNLIYFRDELSSYKLQLYRESKALKTKHNVKHLWIKNCTIFMRKTDDSRIFQIASRNNLITFDRHHSAIIENTQEIHNNSILDNTFESAV